MDFQIPLTGWVWIPENNGLNQNEPSLVYFRKQFEWKKSDCPVRIQISADSRYKLYINGVFAAAGPSKGDRELWFYDEMDITGYLADGENVIAAEVLRYPAGAAKGNYSVMSTEYPGFYVREVEDDEAGQKLGLSSDDTWKCAIEEQFQMIPESPIFAPLMIFENRCGDKRYEGWKTVQYDDAAWPGARCLNLLEMNRMNAPQNMEPRTIPYMRTADRRFEGLYGRFDSVRPKETWEQMLSGRGSVTIPADCHEAVEINAGELMTGYLSLRMKQGRGSVVKLLTSEGYVREESKDDMFGSPKKADRMDCKCGHLHGFTDTYTVSGFERTEEVYEPFWFRTFRFIRLEITTKEEPLTLTGFDYIENGYPLEPKAHVSTSDKSLEKIWDISLCTLKRCMHETYEDCPFYEQLQYAMDSRSQMLYTYSVAADDRLARKCMEDFRHSQRYDGMLCYSYPNRNPSVIPGFSIYYIAMLYDHMMYFGDKAFLRKHMGCVDGILEFFHENLNEQGLVGKVGGLNVIDRYWSFIDWTAQWDATTGMPGAGMAGPITMESLLYIMGLAYAADILAYLGRDSVAEEYMERAGKVREAVRQHCIDEDGMVMDGPGFREYSQHGQVFAILTDTVSEEQGRKNLLRTLDRTEEYAQCSVAMAYYLFRAMEKTGLYDRMDERWNLWRSMLDKNLTTCVEDGVTERSDCHAWGAVALYELPAVTLGVRPAAPGFVKARICPVPGYITCADGEAATKYGNIKVSWKLDENGKMLLDYTVPDSIQVIDPLE